MNIDQLLNIISVASWGLFIFYLAVGLLVTARRRGLAMALGWLISGRLVVPLLIPLSIQIISLGLIYVQPQESGVVMSVLEPRGYRDAPLQSGLHWKWPFLENVVIYPIFWQTYTMASIPTEGEVKGNDGIVARTSDGQEVVLDCSVVFRVDAEQVVQVHIDWQDRYINELVRPVVRSIVRSRVAAFTVDEVNSQKRQNLEADLNRILSEQLAENGLELDQFLLRNISFSDEYAASVERKQVALQQVTEAQYEADQVRRRAQGEADRFRFEAEGRADAIRIEAAAEADALEVIKAALANDPGLLNYRYIDKIPANIQVMLLPNDAPLLLPLPTLSPNQADDPTAAPTATPVPEAATDDG